MSVVCLIVRSELRRRWRSLCVLLLLVGLVGAVVLTAVAGARRTDSAVHRLLDQTRNHDASVEVSPEYFDAVAALPQVDAVAPASFMFVRPRGVDADNLISIAGTDERFGNLVNRPLLLEGRRPSPDNATEVLVNTAVADRLGVTAGDLLTLSSMTPHQLESLLAGDNPGEPAGPTIQVIVVGVGATAEELANKSMIVVLTPAFYLAHRDDVAHFDDILEVRLRHGDADIVAFRDGVNRVVVESEGAIVESAAETVGEIKDATSVQAIALVAFAVAAALAGFVAIYQAVTRQVAASSAEQPHLRALGLRPRQRVMALVIPLVFVAIGGACLAVVASLLASPSTPTGFARRVEPDRGFAGDGLVLTAGFASIVAIVSASAWLSASLTTRRTAERPAAASRFLERPARMGAPPAAAVGISMALQAGRGRSAVPVRPALAASVAGIAGLVAALTFAACLDWVVTDRAAYGWQWDTSVRGPSTSDELAEITTRIAENQNVDGVAALSVLPIFLEGQALTSYGLNPKTGSGFVTALAGRAPNSADEVMVGSLTLDRLDRQVGDKVSAVGLEGGNERTFTIVGRGVFPEFIHPAVPDSDTGAYNDFALFTENGNQTFAADAGGEYFSLVLIRWAAGVDREAATRELEDKGNEVQSTTLPSNLENLTRIRTIPLTVATFLVLLAAVALAHALVMSTQRRGRDLAILKTLGFVSSQIRTTLATQATTIAAAGLALGIPAGLLLGRLIWAVVAHNLGVNDHLSTSLLAIFLIIPVTLTLANVIATLPARSAVRTQVGAALRRD